MSQALRVDNPSKLGSHLYMQPTIYRCCRPIRSLHFNQSEAFILTICRWEAISSGRESGQRLGCEVTGPGHSCGLALRGGVHLTSGAFLPNTILKVSAL